MKKWIFFTSVVLMINDLFYDLVTENLIEQSTLFFLFHMFFYPLTQLDRSFFSLSGTSVYITSAAR